MADELVAVPRAIGGAARPLEVEARVSDAMLETRADKLVVPEEQTTLHEASEGVVGHTMQTLSPLVVPPAVEEEDEVEEIKHEES